MRNKYLVIGGGGFLGKAITDQLLEMGIETSIFDLQAREIDPRITIFLGDITNLDQVREACAGNDVVIHTASPIHGKPSAVYFKVNVDGTQNVIDACVKEKVAKLIYTSSAGVIYNGQDLINADETVPYCEVHMDAYNETKAIAEKAVLDANGKGGLLTCAIRPSGIFGPRYKMFSLLFRDAQGSLAIVQSAKKGQSKIMIGKNENLFDLTYVDNAAYAHILAGEKMKMGTGIEGQVLLLLMTGLFDYKRSTHLFLGLSKNFTATPWIQGNAVFRPFK